jgi:hypothetical protein
MLPKPSAIPAGLKFMFELIGMLSSLSRHALDLIRFRQRVLKQQLRQIRNRPALRRRLGNQPPPRHRINPHGNLCTLTRRRCCRRSSPSSAMPARGPDDSNAPCLEPQPKAVRSAAPKRRHHPSPGPHRPAILLGRRGKPLTNGRIKPDA